MTTLREAAQQALAEPVHETGVKLKPVFYSPKRLTNEELDAALQRLTDVHQDIEATHNIK